MRDPRVDGSVVDDQRRRRRRITGKSAETRRRRLQYMRRHNEKDGRLFYCDYCDLFVSSAPRSWSQHLNGGRHMDAVESYYTMVEYCDGAWLNSLRECVARSHVEERVRQHQLVAGKGSTLPIPEVAVGFTGGQCIRVGGPQTPQHELQEQQTPSRLESVRVGSPSVRVGGLLVAAASSPPVVVRVAGKAVVPPGTKLKP